MKVFFARILWNFPVWFRIGVADIYEISLYPSRTFFFPFFDIVKLKAWGKRVGVEFITDVGNCEIKRKINDLTS